MKKVRTYLYPFEAERARNDLEANGIHAYVENANSQTTLSYIGTAVGGVRLMVATEDIARAEEILSAELEDSNIAEWVCSCGSEVDAGFQVCWKCGTSRTRDTPPEEVSEDGGGKLDEADQEPDYSAQPSEIPPADSRDFTNQYHPPLADPSRVRIEQPTDAGLEDSVRRGWVAALLGVVFIPVLAHILSLLLLSPAMMRLDELSPKARKRFWLAIAIDICALLIASIFLANNYL